MLNRTKEHTITLTEHEILKLTHALFLNAKTHAEQICNLRGKGGDDAENTIHYIEMEIEDLRSVFNKLRAEVGATNA